MSFPLPFRKSGQVIDKRSPPARRSWNTRPLGRYAAQTNAQASAHRLLHERSDPCLVVGGHVRAKAVGQMAPSSRFAVSLKPNVAYLDLNLCAGWRKQTTLAVLGVRGHPYQSSALELARSLR